MPYIHLRLGTTLETRQREQLCAKTTELMSTIMGKKREVTVVHIHESDPRQWAINGMMLSDGEAVGAYVDIKVTQGTNTREEKAEMIQQMLIMLQEVIGAIQEACYVVIDDIPADSWGYHGVTQAARAARKPRTS